MKQGKLTLRDLTRSARVASFELGGYARPDLFAEPARARLYERLWCSLQMLAGGYRALPVSARRAQAARDVVNARACALELGFTAVATYLPARAAELVR